MKEKSDTTYAPERYGALLIGPLNSNDEWVRPLEEEGIEPHPGPRYVSKNVNGLASP